MGFRDFIASLFGKAAHRVPAAPAPRPGPAKPAVNVERAPSAAPRPRAAPPPSAPREPVPVARAVTAPAPPPTPEAAPVPAPEPQPAASAPRDDAEDFDSVLDAAFAGENLPTAHAASATEPPQDHDEVATAELFGEIAELQSRPVRNFIFDLRRGTADRESLEICRPIMGSLIQAAESIGLTSAVTTMRAFDEALETAQSDEGAALTWEHRERILVSYQALEALLGEEAQRRDTVIIHSLLRQIPNVGHVTFERLYGAGVTSLETLLLASPTDLVNTTGIPLWLSEQICEKLQEYRRQSETASSEAAADDLRKELLELVDEFRRQHDRLRQADELPSVQERTTLKRESRRSRKTCALQINVVLAAMGQLDLAEEIQKLGFERRIERLETFLDSTLAGRPAAPDRNRSTAQQR